MEHIANQINRDDTGDVVKDMQNAPSSANMNLPLPSSKGDSDGVVDGSGNGNTGVGGSGSQTKVIVFNSTNFEDGYVFQLKDSDQNRKIIGFSKPDSKTTLDVVQWQVINDDNIESLGDVEFRDAKTDGQLTDGMYALCGMRYALVRYSSSVTDTLSNAVDNNSVTLNFGGGTSKYYGKEMYIQIDWKKDGASGYTKTELFTVTNTDNTTEISELNDQLKKDQSQQETLESTTSSSSSATATLSPSSTAGAEESSGGGGGGGGGLSTGATAGIAVGAVIGGLLIIGALVWFFLRRRRRSKKAGDEYVTQQTYAVDKETHGRAADSPNSPYSDENHMQPVALGSLDRDRGVAPTPPPGGVPRSSIGSHDRAAHSGAQTPQGMSSNVAHLVEDGMTVDEIRRLEEEERQLDDEIERAARR
ncbi:Uncharacterized protein LW94_6396 [Fusarium fujikuroi]|uniref:Uncharacterized protein n=1 Tax=Fusarium fujikuroi TaxID=5127 RepID=A0A9Q9UFZ8_FUSFU|nr:Uncharacterized protein LW94_6396 [Fusarium fujikuroi]QGI58953.1 hypothetical protein CEK27_001078 [Fusarium fujikuroi]QGI76168.1 hypothetical protein CEK25_001074 [Fusarium fujikuroi]VTT58509.1 unnamed protein product [Fusarium fujikuroi]VTT82406.1 unnamed protein product [Fusarium fujikuroi]